MIDIETLIPGATSTLRKRVWAQIVRGKRRECWRWVGILGGRGTRGGRRPRIRVGGRGSRIVHVTRILLALKDGVPLQERTDAGLEAGHIRECNHYWCVNPAHLEWQTRSENEQQKHDRDEYDDFANDVDLLACEEREERASDDSTRDHSQRRRSA
jgi:hypothetical protein